MSGVEEMHTPPSVTQRLEKLEQYIAKQGESISSVAQEYLSLKSRVAHLEELAQSRAITEAREDERDKALYERLDRMETQIKDTRGEIKDIRGIGSKALWVFISAIIVAAAAFMIKGGLAR